MMNKDEYLQAIQQLAPQLPDGQQYYYQQQPGGYDYYSQYIKPPEECFMLPAAALDEMRRAIETIHRNGNCFEVRLMNTADPVTFTNDNGDTISYTLTYSGTFDSFQSFAKALHDFSFFGRDKQKETEYRQRGDKLHFYISLQGLSKGYVEEVKKTKQWNKFRKCSAGNTRQTKATDIVVYRNLLFDFDPVRPANTSSTEDQRQAAEDIADAVINHLSDNGFPLPVKALSGNGYHIMYAVNIPRDAAADRLISNLYTSIQAFVGGFNNTVKVDFDMSFANKPAQLGKLWGSRAKKGNNTPETPHRWSKIVSAPGTLVEVTIEQIQKYLSDFPPVFAAPGTPPGTKRATRTAAKTTEPIQTTNEIIDFLTENQVSYRVKQCNDGTTKYIVKCPWEDTHTTTTNQDDAAVFFQGETKCFSCFHAHCSDKHWSDFVKIHEKLTYKKCLDINTNKDGKVTSVKVNPGRLAALIQQDYKYMFVQSGNTEEVRRYFYENGVYVRYSNDKIQGLIRGIITDISYQTRAAIQDTFYVFSMQNNYEDEEELNKEPLLINFQNGLYDMTSNKMLPHTPDVLSTVQFNTSYEPDKHYTLDDAPVFKQYIHSLFDGVDDKIQFILEFIGGCITNIPGWRFKKNGNAVFLVGASDSGKSQLINLIQYILNKRNCATIKFGRLDERFQSGVLYGKRLIIDAEMSFGKSQSIEMFKSITGGDPIQIEDKHQKPFIAVYNGFVLCASNKLPQWGGDTSRTVTERMTIMKCPNAVPKEKQDAHLLDKMIKEINVIISLALDAFRGVIDRGYRFTHFAELDANLLELDIENNTAIEFYETCCVLLPDTATNPASRYKVHDMYAAYCTWCVSEKGYTQTAKAFKQAVLAHSKTTITQKDCGYTAYAFTLTYESAAQLGAVPPTYNRSLRTVQQQPIFIPPTKSQVHYDDVTGTIVDVPLPANNQ